LFGKVIRIIGRKQQRIHIFAGEFADDRQIRCNQRTPTRHVLQHFDRTCALRDVAVVESQRRGTYIRFGDQRGDFVMRHRGLDDHASFDSRLADLLR
jgi:hypothetical protein